MNAEEERKRLIMKILAIIIAFSFLENGQCWNVPRIKSIGKVYNKTELLGKPRSSSLVIPRFSVSKNEHALISNSKEEDDEAQSSEIKERIISNPNARPTLLTTRTPRTTRPYRTSGTTKIPTTYSIPNTTTYSPPTTFRLNAPPKLSTPVSKSPDRTMMINQRALGSSSSASDFRCEKSGLYPSPDSCSHYIQCDGGRKFIRPCGPGTVFNPKILNCDFPYNVDCQGKRSKREIYNEETHAIKKRDGIKPKVKKCEVNGRFSSKDCQSYEICSNGISHSFKCPPGTLLNQIGFFCDFAANVDCSENRADWQSWGCEETWEYLTPHPESCTKFYECTRGTFAIKECAQGAAFDSVTLKCEHRNKVVCNSPVIIDTI